MNYLRINVKININDLYEKNYKVVGHFLILQYGNSYIICQDDKNRLFKRIFPQINV